jgi:hypothetical protein
MTTIAPLDIEAATPAARDRTECEPHDPKYIRTRLRTVSEDFYREGDPALFREAASLDKKHPVFANRSVRRSLQTALEDLKISTNTSRGESHAPI